MRLGAGRAGSMALHTMLLALGLALAASGCSSTLPPKPAIGVILPDDDAGQRWNDADRPALENEIKGQDYAYNADIENASSPTEATETTTKMIDGGSKVIVFAAVARDIESAITATAHARGIPTIGYDLTDTAGASSRPHSARFVVATDQRKVGELAARGVVRGLRDQPGATVIELQSAPTRDAQTQVAAGEANILGPRYDTHTYRLLAIAQVNPADPPATAATLTRLLNTHGGTAGAILTTNDAVAQAAITVLRQRGQADKTTVTGYGASPQALKAILRGEQFITGYTSPAAQAEKAATVAKALAQGDQATLDQLAQPAPAGQPRTLLVDPTATTLTNIDDIFNSGIADSDDVCDNTLALRCNELSIP